MNRSIWLASLCIGPSIACCYYYSKTGPVRHYIVYCRKPWWRQDLRCWLILTIRCCIFVAMVMKILQTLVSGLSLTNIKLWWCVLLYSCPVLWAGWWPAVCTSGPAGRCDAGHVLTWWSAAVQRRTQGQYVPISVKVMLRTVSDGDADARSWSCIVCRMRKSCAGTFAIRATFCFRYNGKLARTSVYISILIGWVHS